MYELKRKIRDKDEVCEVSEKAARCIALYWEYLKFNYEFEKNKHKSEYDEEIFALQSIHNEMLSNLGGTENCKNLFLKAYILKIRPEGSK